jgi:hypothetical protein
VTEEDAPEPLADEVADVLADARAVAVDEPEPEPQPAASAHKETNPARLMTRVVMLSAFPSCAETNQGTSSSYLPLATALPGATDS